MRFDLSDDEWALLEPLMPRSRKSARADDRKIMNAIFYVLRTGMPWHDLPERYGPYIEYIYNEIFLGRGYDHSRITLPERPTIIDVGANVGLFTI